ncbi:MAG TPA: hypothetical protein VL359_13705 [bacterium]|nr:hypothetical protein [bacterium]
MDRLKGDKFLMFMFLLFLAALAAGCLMFFNGMRESSYLVNDGVGYVLNYVDKPRYDSHLQGLIFAVTFLIAGLILTIVILMPSTATLAHATREALAPQPQVRQRAARPAPVAAAQPAPTPQPAPTVAQVQQAAAQMAAAAAPPPEEPAKPAAPPPAPVQRSIEEAVAAAEPKREAASARSVDEEVLRSGGSEDLDRLDREDARFEDTGEDNVVYGNGRVTDDSVWEFVQAHPDSAVKFLYRKTLDNKPLNTTEEEIYRRWELRGMTRAKVREIVLDIMQWKTLPDDFPHNIWRELRDRVFEMRSH